MGLEGDRAGGAEVVCRERNRERLDPRVLVEDMAGALARDRVADRRQIIRVGIAQRSDLALGRLDLRTPLRVLRAGQLAGLARVDHHHVEVRRDGHRYEGEGPEVDQQRVAVDPADRGQLVHDPARDARRS